MISNKDFTEEQIFKIVKKEKFEELDREEQNYNIDLDQLQKEVEEIDVEDL